MNGIQIFVTIIGVMLSLFTMHLFYLFIENEKIAYKYKVDEGDF